MSEGLLLMFLIAHFVADFIMQTREQAVNKSKSIAALLSHTGWYSFAMFFFVLMIVSYNSNVAPLAWEGVLVMKIPLLFGLITFVCHSITDFFTSKLTSYLYKKKDYHNFFVVIGFDQILHYLQLYLTYKLLF